MVDIPNFFHHYSFLLDFFEPKNYILITSHRNHNELQLLSKYTDTKMRHGRTHDAL